MNYKTGDIIHRTCPFPLITHVGIVVNENQKSFVYHNTALKKNESGGNVVKMPIDEFLKLGKIIKVTKSELSADQIILHAFKVRAKKYSALFYNCEDFVNEVVKGRKGSPQRVGWIGAGIAAFFVRNKLKNSDDGNVSGNDIKL